MLNQASRDIILLQEILAYLRESLVEMEDMEVPADHGGKRLFKVLSVGTMRRDILMRCVDLNKLCEGTASQLTTLQQMTDVINTKQLEEVFDNVNANTKYLVDASAANERSSLLTFIVVIPSWPEQACWVQLRDSSHTAAHIVFPASKHAYIDGGQQHGRREKPLRLSNHDTSVFLLQSTRAAALAPMTHAKERRLREAFTAGLKVLGALHK